MMKVCRKSNMDARHRMICAFTDAWHWDGGENEAVREQYLE